MHAFLSIQYFNNRFEKLNKDERHNLLLFFSFFSIYIVLALFVLYLFKIRWLDLCVLHGFQFHILEKISEKKATSNFTRMCIQVQYELWMACLLKSLTCSFVQTCILIMLKHIFHPYLRIYYTIIFVFLFWIFVVALFKKIEKKAC